MNSPPTTPLSRRQRTSKTRFLCDGAEEICPQCHFSQLRGTALALLGPLNPSPGAQDTHLNPYLIPF
jgi:hypothetical protein